MTNEREYSLNFRNGSDRSYLVDDTYVRPTTDYRRSEHGKDMFTALSSLINDERRLIDTMDDVSSRKVHVAVTRSLSHLARQVVTRWEEYAVEYETPDAYQLLVIERRYYLSLLSQFDETAIASIGMVGSIPVLEFYRDVAKAAADDVDLQVRFADRLITILGRFSENYAPRVRRRIAEIDTETALNAS